MALSIEEKQQFLAQPHIAALSVIEPGRGPLTVPIWYDYEPGGRAWIVTGPGSRKHLAIEAAGRFTLMVDTKVPPLRYVTVEGPVVESRAATDDEVDAMARRYLEGEELEGYLRFARELGEHVMVVLEPEHWLGAAIAV